MFVKIILYFAEPSCLLKYEYGILKDGPYRNHGEQKFYFPAIFFTGMTQKVEFHYFTLQPY